MATPVAVAPRNPAVFLIVSFFVPRLGSMMNGRPWFGATILLVYLVGAILAVMLIGVPIALGAWIWGMADGYRSAQAWNHARGLVG